MATLLFLVEGFCFVQFGACAIGRDKCFGCYFSLNGMILYGNFLFIQLSRRSGYMSYSS